MPRKKEPSSTTEQGIFPSRLRGLIEEKKTTQAKLAQAIDMRPQTVSLYVTGQSFPDVNTLRKIAIFFEVSADYLLGLTDIQKPDANLQAAGAYTGLSEKALLKIAQWHSVPRVENDPGTQWVGEHLLGKLVETDGFDKIMEDITGFVLYGGLFSKPVSEPVLEPSKDEFAKFYRWMKSKNLKMMGQDVIQDFYLQRAADTLKETVRELFADAARNGKEIS